MKENHTDLMPNSAPVLALQEAARTRRQQALRIKRDERLNYRQLGERLGVSRQRAQAMCKRAIADGRR